MSIPARVGSSAAFATFGVPFTKEARAWMNPRLLGTVGGMATGAMLAPEGQGVQGAVLGGTVGYAGGAGLSRLARGRSRPPAPRRGGGLWGHTLTPGTPPRPAGGGAAMGRSPAALGAGGLVDAGFTVSNSVPQGVKVGFEGGIGMGIPGTPFGFSTGMRNKDERLPEMDSWVNRAVIERAFKGTRAGLDPEALMDLEAQQGQFKSPAVGALAAAAATKKFLPSAGNTGAAIAALLGAGGGAMYHHKTEDSRRQSMLDALRGVYAERGPPIQGQAQVTSHEAPAMITSNAGGDA